MDVVVEEHIVDEMRVLAQHLHGLPPRTLGDGWAAKLDHFIDKVEAMAPSSIVPLDGPMP